MMRLEKDQAAENEKRPQSMTIRPGKIGPGRERSTRLPAIWSRVRLL